jgi:hypothetical protein
MSGTTEVRMEAYPRPFSFFNTSGSEPKPPWSMSPFWKFWRVESALTTLKMSLSMLGLPPIKLRDYIIRLRL